MRSELPEPAPIHQRSENGKVITPNWKEIAKQREGRGREKVVARPLISRGEAELSDRSTLSKDRDQEERDRVREVLTGQSSARIRFEDRQAGLLGLDDGEVEDDELDEDEATSQTWVEKIREYLKRFFT